MSTINEESILKSIRKLIGPEDDYTHFDPDIVLHINAAINRLFQLGLAEAKGFRVTSIDDTWGDLFGSDEDVIDMCKTFIYYKVKLGFDPPASSFVLSSFEKEVEKQEWLISVWIESNKKE